MGGFWQHTGWLTARTRRPALQPIGYSATVGEEKMSTRLPPPTRSSTNKRIPLYDGWMPLTAAAGGCAWLKTDTAIRLSSGLTAKPTSWFGCTVSLVTSPVLPSGAR